MRLFDELKRRKVHRAAALYIAGAWAGTEIAVFLLEKIPLFPAWAETVVAILFVLGFPVTMFLAWTFDLDAEGVRRTAPDRRTRSLTVLASIALLLAGTVGLSAWILPRIVTVPEEAGVTETAPETDAIPAPPNSVAVLPFHHIDGAEETAWFADGVTEEILNRLASLDALRVAARTSAFRFRDPERNLRDIARQLGVRYLVEGTVRRAGDRLRVSARLVEAHSGFPLWSDRFDGAPNDIFAFQDDIASNVARALGNALSLPALGETITTPSTTTDAENYDRYLLARAVWRQREEVPIRRSIELLEEVVAEDPEFAPGWTALASARMTLLAYSSDVGGAAAQAGDTARRALALDDDQAEAHAVLANLALFRREWVEADTRFRRAVELNPNNPTVRLWYSEFLAKLGHLESAIAQSGVALEVDPLYTPALGNAAHQLASAGRVREAAAMFQRTWDLGLDAMFVWVGGFYTALMEGRWDDAEAWLGRRPFPDGAAVDRALLKALRSGAAEDRAAAVTAIQRGLDAGSPLREGVFYLGALDATDAAYARLVPAVADGWVSTESLWSLWTDDIRHDTRFPGLLDTLGMLGYYELYGPPDNCALVAGRLDCRL